MKQLGTVCLVVMGLARVAAAQAPHEAAELEYRHQAIRFGHTDQLAGTGTSVDLVGSWEIYQGDQELSPVDFYNAVGRPDLAGGYQTRRCVGGVGIFAGTGVTLLGLALFKLASAPVACASAPGEGGSPCMAANERATSQRRERATIVSLTGVALAGVGLWFVYHPHPISEGQAKQLADVYNQKLRHQLGLSAVSQRPPLIRQLALAPFAGDSGAGLSLSGQF